RRRPCCGGGADPSACLRGLSIPRYISHFGLGLLSLSDSQPGVWLFGRPALAPQWTLRDGLALVVLAAEGLQVCERVVVAGTHVVHIGRRGPRAILRAEHTQEPIALQSCAATLCPVRGEAGLPVRSGPAVP